MKFNKLDVYNSLVQRLDTALNSISQLQALSHEQLTKRPSPNAWSAAECAEHLCIYADFYNPAFKKALQQHKNKKNTAQQEYKAGWIGNYFVGMLDSSKGQPKKKMKTMKKNDPLKMQKLRSSVLSALHSAVYEQKQLLEQAKDYDWEKLKIPVSIAPWLKIRLGDALRFVILHIERHLIQAQKAV